MPKLTVPLLSYPPGQVDPVIGSGFFVRNNGRVFLVTAAHVPLGVHQHENWQLWPDVVNIHAKGQLQPLPLFDGAGASRKPRFVYAGDEGMSDFLALHILGNPFQPGGPLGDVEVVDCPAAITLAPGDAVRGAGYPHVKAMWPYEPADVWTGTFRRRDGSVLTADANIAKGHSGGPAFDASGNWIGMCIGWGTGDGGSTHTMIVAADYICDLLSQV